MIRLVPAIRCGAPQNKVRRINRSRVKAAKRTRLCFPLYVAILPGIRPLGSDVHLHFRVTGLRYPLSPIPGIPGSGPALKASFTMLTGRVLHCGQGRVTLS